MPRKLPEISNEEYVLTLQMLQGIVPMPRNMEVLANERLAREREEKFRQVQARLKRNAETKFREIDPKFVAAQVKRRAARDAKRAAQGAATAARKAEAKAKRRQALDANPTLAWRHPRRAGWTPTEDYARGSRRKNRPAAIAGAAPAADSRAGASNSTPASADSASAPQDDSRSRTACPDPRS